MAEPFLFEAGAPREIHPSRSAIQSLSRPFFRALNRDFCSPRAKIRRGRSFLSAGRGGYPTVEFEPGRLEKLQMACRENNSGTQIHSIRLAANNE